MDGNLTRVKRIRQQNNQDYSHYCHFRTNTMAILMALWHTYALSVFRRRWRRCCSSSSRPEWLQQRIPVSGTMWLKAPRAGWGWIRGMVMISAAFLVCIQWACQHVWEGVRPFFIKTDTEQNKTHKRTHTKCFFIAVVLSELKISVCVGALTRLQPCSLPVCEPTRVSVF